jgi:hypothetical protein
LRLTEERELPCIYSAQPNREVTNGSEDDGSDDGGGDLSDDLSEEVGGDGVHVVVDFSQEDRALVREDQDDVLDRVERDCHGHEEECTVSVLHALDCSVTVLEKNDAEDSSDNGDDEFNI